MIQVPSSYSLSAVQSSNFRANISTLTNTTRISYCIIYTYATCMWSVQFPIPSVGKSHQHAPAVKARWHSFIMYSKRRGGYERGGIAPPDFALRFGLISCGLALSSHWPPAALFETPWSICSPLKSSVSFMAQQLPWEATGNQETSDTIYAPEYKGGRVWTEWVYWRALILTLLVRKATLKSPQRPCFAR